MSEQQTTITQELEHLFKKTTEANRVFLDEGARFVKQLGSSKLTGEQLFTRQKQLLTDAFTLFVKLNIQYTSSLIDLGLAITKRINQPFSTTQEDTGLNPGDPNEAKPAFVLNTSAVAGDKAIAQFLLDSGKEEPVLCTLKQTGYVLQEDPSVKVFFETAFSPQSFRLLPGESQKVEVAVFIPADAKEGVYLGNIQADGFEHTFFSLYITVIPISNSIK
jgi:hypothetical protein